MHGVKKARCMLFVGFVCICVCICIGVCVPIRICTYINYINICGACVYVYTYVEEECCISVSFVAAVARSSPNSHTNQYT